MGRRLRYGDEFRKLALFRRSAGEYERIDESRWSELDMEVHEHPVLDGEVGELRAAIEHRECRGLEHYIAKHNAYSSWEAARYVQLQQVGDGEAPGCLTVRQQKKYRYLGRWWAAPVYFMRGYILREGFLDGWVGLCFAVLKSVYFFQVYLKIKEARAAGREPSGERV